MKIFVLCVAHLKCKISYNLNIGTKNSVLNELNIRSSFRILTHEFPALHEFFNVNHLKFNKQRVFKVL